MAESSLDINNIRWHIYKFPPSLSKYFLTKIYFPLIPSIIVYGLLFYFLNYFVALIVSLFLFFIISIIIYFLYQAVEGKNIYYDIDNQGITYDGKLYKYSEFNKSEIVQLIKPLKIPYNDWNNVPLKEGDNIKIGKLTLEFPSQRIRQQAIKSLLIYLDN